MIKSENKKRNAIFVISEHGEPLMPTKNFGKVRHMLKNNEAKIIKRDPFIVIQLLKPTECYVQPIKAGMDIGQTIGLSVISNNKELFSAQLETRSHTIASKLTERRHYRRTRRNKLRYREARFDNRGSSKGTCKHCGGNSVSKKKFCRKCLKEVDNIHQKYSDDIKPFNEKRLSPCARHIIDVHFKIKNTMTSYLPMCSNDWIIEKTKFDVQKIEKIDISGVAYQQGDMFGFSSLREFILDRDNHECQNPNCKHNKKDKGKKENIYFKNNIVLQLHHLKFKSKGGTDKPSNFITLCVDCHTSKNHQPGNFLYDWCNDKKTIPTTIKSQLKKDYSAATKMNVVSSAFNDVNDVCYTVGSETKRKRQLIGLEKTHANDAFSICFDNNNFEMLDDKSKKNIKLKENLNIEKVEHTLILKQTNGRENGRRSLRSIEFPKFIDSRDGTIKTANELSIEKSKRVFTTNNRQYRKYRCDKNGNKKSKNKNKKYRKDGVLLDNNATLRKGKSLFPNNSIVEFHNVNGKDVIYESGGMTGNNIVVKNEKQKFLAYKKYKAAIICNRNGIIKENIKIN